MDSKSRILKAGMALLCCLTFNNNFEDLYELIMKNIEASKEYDLPTNNHKLGNLTSKKTHYFGTYDFIIVGAGASGSVLANRLSQNRNWNVLLLEAGKDQTDFSYIPGMSPYLMLSDMNWGYRSTPQTNCCLGMNNQTCSLPRGKVLGGSTVLNGKLYVRGNKADFDYWADLGNNGWSYDEILPCYLKLENSLLYEGDENYHNTTGELSISNIRTTPVSNIFYTGMQEMGYKYVDYNGKEQIGVSRVQVTQNCNKVATGATAFLHPLNKRSNLNITTQALVSKILLTKCKSAYGVTFIKNGLKYKAKASKEVILSAGAINTPQLLLLSGIGPKDELKNIGINPVIDLPAVGKYMEDHPMFTGLIFHTNISLYDEGLKEYLEQYLKNQGPLTASFNFDSIAFFDPLNGSSSTPTIEVQMVSSPGIDYTEVNPFYVQQENLKSYAKNYNRHTDILLFPALLHPKSKGSVTLKSDSIADFPLIDMNYFNDENGDDIEVLYNGVLEMLKLLKTDAFKAVNASLVNVAEYCGIQNESREYWYCAIKHLTTTNYHHAGTARMGKNKKHSVVNSFLKVHGVKNFRIADASIMPSITSGNTQAPSYVIGEKASQIIKQDYGIK